MNKIINEKDIIADKGNIQINKESKEHKLLYIAKLNNYLKEKNKQFSENFELLELVGSGSESDVYKTMFKKTKKIICCKIIRKKNQTKIQNYNEYKISNILKNKNIIDTYGGSIIKEGEIDCILMEYAKYGNLRDFQKLLRKRMFSESFLCFISYQILSGLKYLYINKITHMDLKPQNLIFDEYLNIKIIDFSVSLDYKKIDSNKIKLPFRGTNFYIAPEVINNETINVNDLNKIDLYSLGVILYNLAFCKYPFDLKNEDAKNYDKIYKKIMKGWELKDKENNNYSSYFIDFLQKLLEKDINKRININEALNHYWVKGGKIIYDEKEKINNTNIFLIYLIKNNIKNFNDYIKNKNDFFDSY